MTDNWGMNDELGKARETHEKLYKTMEEYAQQSQKQSQKQEENEMSGDHNQPPEVAPEVTPEEEAWQELERKERDRLFIQAQHRAGEFDSFIKVVDKKRSENTAKLLEARKKIGKEIYIS